jgi:hypothetical protein
MASGIDCDSVKDAWQSCIELSALEACPYLMQFRINTGGTGMSLPSLASAPAGIEIRSIDNSFKTVVLFCCAGLLASFGLMVRGIELSAGLM